MKQINVFEIVPERFFTVLSSKNKDLYMNVISMIYVIVNSGLSYGINKDILVDEIEDYLNNSVLEYDEEEFYSEVSSAQSNRDKANFLIRKLEECGWIYSETTTNYIKVINFHDYAVTILESFIKIVNKESVEYQGNIIGIYTMLYADMNDTSPGVIVKSIYENSKSIISGLKKLNSNIKKYMDRLTKQKTPQEIMEEFFGNYTSEVIDKSYHRLKTSENISRYRPKILEKINEFLKDEVFLKQSGELFMEEESMENLQSGIEKTKEILSEIVNAFENIDDIMHEIDDKNSKYIRSAVTRAKFLLNNSKDMSGLLKGILEYTSTKYKELDLNLSVDYLEEITDLFTLYSYGYIDESSFYVSNEGKKSFKPEKLTKNTVSAEERKRRLSQFKEKQKNKYSIKKINSIVDDILGDIKCIKISEANIDTVEDFIKVIYIRIYAGNVLSHYKIKRHMDIVNRNGFEFRNFEIWRK